jgi:murein DD-endopeptidase MepM/ murein hydrolase activator NlpD
MSSRPSRSLTWAFGTIFAERRVYIRTAEKTRYLSIRPSSQIGGAIVIAALLGWTGFTTTTYISNAMDGHNARIQLETMSEAYDVRLAAFSTQQRSLEVQLSQANQRRDEVTARLSDKQARLVETANSLQEAKAELAVLRNEFEALIVARREDAAQVEMLDIELSGLRLAFSDTETSKANLDGALQSLSGAMDKVIAERDLAAGEVNRLDGEVTRLTNSMDQLEDRQERLVSQLEVAAQTSLDGLSTMFGRSKIDLDRILTRARRDYTGSGGPLEPLIGEAEDAVFDTNAGDTRVAALMDNLETVNLMRFAADRLPFGEPVFGGRRTSGFGPRRGRYHKGLDIAAPQGTAIHSTAEGVVTFSGRQRGYGIVVKIRHAFGFETVYAHLRRTRVKVGQRVERGDRIGDMGNTGRSTGSTGTHLHYEILIDKKPVNPIKFIEATRDVL